MAAEVALSFSTLRSQLESEKNKLQKIDESIKKVVQTPGRFSDRYQSPKDNFQRGSNRQARNNSFQEDVRQIKRKQETKTVFSRLSVRNDASDEEGEFIKKPRLSSHVIKDLPSKQDVLKAQCGDEVSKNRNRRMFGSLLGTLQKFKQEEIELKTKEEKKAKIEKKIEDQAKQEIENRKRERQHLFAEREAQKANIKTLEIKMARIEAFEQWEATQKKLCHFILTKAKPHVYWLPKLMNEKAADRLEDSRKFNENLMERKRAELQDELVEIEQKIRIRVNLDKSQINRTEDEQSPTKRDKFSKDPKDDGNASGGSSPREAEVAENNSQMEHEIEEQGEPIPITADNGCEDREKEGEDTQVEETAESNEEIAQSTAEHEEVDANGISHDE